VSTSTEGIRLSPESEVTQASQSMVRFAERTGIRSTERTRRYLWTDAFAVCNFLTLSDATAGRAHRDLAIELVDRVHHTLGRHRPGDSRFGWLSGLGEAEGELHPTRGGLRIGKPLPEREENERLDQELEWERDGQYFHYLTKWMHALNQVSRRTRDPRFNVWARELAETACSAFTREEPITGRRRLVWKMSVDLSRPQVAAMSPHDPLDGFVTCAELRATAAVLGATAAGPTLERELAQLAAMLDETEWLTADPLGIGGLLFDACRLGQLVASGAIDKTSLLDDVLIQALDGLRLYVAQDDLRRSASQRLAFRELGLAIGLLGTRFMGPADPELLEALREYLPLGSTIRTFWLNPEHRHAASWTEHLDINEVMLATVLAPEGFLAL